MTIQSKKNLKVFGLSLLLLLFATSTYVLYQKHQNGGTVRTNSGDAPAGAAVFVSIVAFLVTAYGLYQTFKESEEKN